MALAKTGKDNVNVNVEGTKVATPKVPIEPPIGPQDKKDNLDIGAAAVAAINAARHSVEENKAFYNTVTQIIAWGAGILAFAVSAGGITFLASHAKTIAEKKATEVLEEQASAITTIQNVLGRTDEAKECLGRAILQEPERAEQAYKDSDFYRLRTNPEFLRLIGKSDGVTPDGANSYA